MVIENILVWKLLLQLFFITSAGSSITRYKITENDRSHGILKTYTHVLFDLDGTLTDPKIGITRCVQYALQKFSIDEPDLDRLEPFIGPPLSDSFRRFYGLDETSVQEAIQYYRERFRVKGMYENKLYTDIPKLLEDLRANGKLLAVATSKPTVFATEILKHFEIDHYFECIVGSNLDGTREAKSEVIEYALSHFPNLDKSQSIMIGDREFDIIGARANQIDSIGVVYGYGNEEELQSAGATYIAHSVHDIRSFVL
jgi:phosphoglycolate phosphatase